VAYFTSQTQAILILLLTNPLFLFIYSPITYSPRSPFVQIVRAGFKRGGEVIRESVGEVERKMKKEERSEGGSN
jgi:hypothetical protein